MIIMFTDHSHSGPSWLYIDGWIEEWMDEWIDEWMDGSYIMLLGSLALPDWVAGTHGGSKAGTKATNPPARSNQPNTELGKKLFDRFWCRLADSCN